MSPPTMCEYIGLPPSDVKINPTFLSTDLVTPGRKERPTLPAIGVHTRSPAGYKLWGQETKETEHGHLAYHHFKPSHFDGHNVVVTHRHYDNRILNTLATEQPTIVTPLLLSKCRINDQRMPPPLDNESVENRFIKEPIPEELRNSYFSHRCQFQVFPTAGVDFRTSLGDSGLTCKKECLSCNTAHSIECIDRRLYGTTTYRHHFQTKHKGKNDADNTWCACTLLSAKGNRLPTTKNCRLTNAKIGKNQIARNYRIPNSNIVRGVCFQDCVDLEACTENVLTPQVVDKYQNLKNACSRMKQAPMNPERKKKDSLSPDLPVWPSYPPGNNITNNPPNYPKIILPKYCIHMHPEHHTLSEGTCTCKQSVSIHENRFNRRSTCSRGTSNHLNRAKMNMDEDSEKDGTDTDDEAQATKESGGWKAPKKEYRRMGRGFKTDAHHRFHTIHKNLVPDLRDAAKEGRRHNFFGFNAYVFRG